MTLKKAMQAIEGRNDIATVLYESKVQLGFWDSVFVKYFTAWDELRKYIRKTYCKEVADMLLKYDAFKWDMRTDLEYTNVLGEVRTMDVELTLNYQ